MIDLYGNGGPNVLKAVIAIEELGIAVNRVPVNIMEGEQYTPEFLKISPNNKVPAIVDHDPADGGEPISVFETGAILVYLAEKYGKLMPTDLRGRKTVLEWVFWQVSGQGPMAGQAGHFLNYAADKLPYAINRFSTEINRLTKVLDTRLQGRDYIADDYSIADIACFTWLIFRSHHALELDEYPNVQSWYQRMENRPAIRRVLETVTVKPPAPLTDEQRALLFGTKPA